MVKNGWKYIDFYFLCGWCASDLHQKIVCMAQPNPNGCSQVSNTQIQRCKYKNTQMQDIASLKCLQNIYNTVYELNWHIFPNYWQVRGAPSHQICSFFEHCYCAKWAVHQCALRTVFLALWLYHQINDYISFTK